MMDEVWALNRIRELENRLQRIYNLFAGGPDTSCRTTWVDDGAGGKIECVEVPMDDLRWALDGDLA